MGAAYDLLCENEGLNNRVRSAQKKTREIKKEFIIVLKAIKNQSNDRERLNKIADTLLQKYTPKKKKKVKK